MATKKTIWLSEDGKEHESEVAADKWDLTLGLSNYTIGSISYVDFDTDSNDYDDPTTIEVTKVARWLDENKVKVLAYYGDVEEEDDPELDEICANCGQRRGTHRGCDSLCPPSDRGFGFSDNLSEGYWESGPGTTFKGEGE